MKQVFIFLSTLLMAAACFFEEEAKDENVVLLEDVIYVSSDQLRILGRIYSTAGNVDDHGFYFSKTDDFAEVEISSLGPREDLGLFLADIQPLSQETEYYYKAFVLSAGELVFSSIGIITTFRSQINDVTPRYGNEGDVITIDGINFTDDIEYYFGDNKAEIIERISDFRVLVKVPAHGDNYRVPVTGRSNELILEGGQFDFITGKWTLVKSYDFVRKEALIFQDETSLTIGFGTNASDFIRPDFNTIQINDYSISSITVFGDGMPQAMRGGFSSSLGYFGAGATQLIFHSESEREWVLADQFWKYENGSFINLGNLDLEGINSPTSHNAIAFESGQTLFVGGGERTEFIDNTYTHVPYRKLFKYDGSSWQLINSLPFDFSRKLPHVTVGEEVWFANEDEEIWVYNIPTNEFSLLPIDFDDDLFDYGGFLRLDSTLFLGLSQFRSTLWEIDIETLGLKPKSPFPGNIQYINITSFAHDDKIFFLRAPNTFREEVEMELWMLEPNEFED